MKRLLMIGCLTLAAFSAAIAQPHQRAAANNMTGGAAPAAKRGPVFRATKEQITQAQTMLKQQGHYSGEATGKLDDATRAGLKKFQSASGIKETGTLNRITLEKMNITLTEKQKAM